MKKMMFLLPIAAVMAACTPAQGVKPRVYAASSTQLLTAISQLGPTVQPLAGYNYFSVIETTANQVTLRAEPTVGVQLLGGNAPIVATFTALQSGNTTSVTHTARLGSDTVGRASAINANIDNIYRELATRFPQIQ